jgi:hypothetical protein
MGTAAIKDTKCWGKALMTRWIHTQMIAVHHEDEDMTTITTGGQVAGMKRDATPNTFS